MAKLWAKAKRANNKYAKVKFPKAVLMTLGRTESGVVVKKATGSGVELSEESLDKAKKILNGICNVIY